MMIGAIAVVLFMLIYYGGWVHRESGHGAQHAVHGGHLGCLEASLTLPGIAGFGAHHRYGGGLQHHHLRAHTRGVTARQVAAQAVDAGFQRAFWTVFSAHVTNFVAGIVLYSYGSGPIRGFAVTLLVGIVSNLLTSVWISRWMFDLIVGRRGSVPRDPFHLAGRRITDGGESEIFRDHQARHQSRIHLATRSTGSGRPSPCCWSPSLCSPSTPTSSRVVATR